MKLTPVQFSQINLLLEGRFSPDGKLQARVIQKKDRINDEEIYKKIFKHVDKSGTMFVEGEVEFNPQEKKYLTDIFEEDMPSSNARIVTEILRLMNAES